MIQKDVIDLIVSRTKVEHRDFIEKDLILQRLLIELSANKYFFENYAFKGGTCIMKCYIPYYRFSEDLDFTYIDQKEFEKKSEKQKRKSISEKINHVGKTIEEACKITGLDFKAVKSDKRYVMIGGSNKQVTFKLWYIPEGSVQETFVKLQINFLENIKYPIVKKNADGFFFGRHEDFRFFLTENHEWILKIPVLKCYDIKEILLEKVRAILTRKGTKARDYLDVYMIEKKEKIDVRDFKKKILNKVRPVLKFEKYKTNLGKRGEDEFEFDRKKEERILLIPLPSDFEAFFNRLKPFLKELALDCSKKS